MCLAIPMKVSHIDGFNATCVAKGVSREVSLFLLQGTTVREGDYVMVHVGYALQLITYEDAQVTWALLDQVVQHDA
tara:strand:+ start:2418 stop:2645 length:228 start_codon:yes stop_codon:yes gene_type:complete